MVKVVENVVDGDPGVHSLLLATDHLHVRLAEQEVKVQRHFQAEVAENRLLLASNKNTKNNAAELQHIFNKPFREHAQAGRGHDVQGSFLVLHLRDMR